MIGTTLGHYRIVEKIGEGGMGEVYRAHDERLDRDVAVKVLHEAVAQDADRLARFEREAKAVAKLSHPNILEIFDFDTEDDVTYAVTELLKGKTLREYLQREPGPLPWRKVQEIGASVANGLGAAHGKGVVHRDIKPSNIFLCTDGRIKILDFGLAATHEVVDCEAETESIEAPLTREGSVMGTVGYMAPEQVRGEAADHRTDVFALGCVLYEMLTGQRAFKRDTTAEIMTAILREEPPSLAESGAQVPPDLAKTVSHCLEKNPERRFQSAADIAFALGSESEVAESPVVPSGISRPRTWAMPLLAIAGILVVALGMVFGPGILERFGDTAGKDQVATAPPRIVVLPFENLGSPDDEYFADGVTEEITSRLAAVSGLQVISRTSAMHYKDRRLPIRQIGEELDVGYVLGGTIRWDRSGDGYGRVRITPQLIKVDGDTHLWSERYDRVLEDIFTVQSEIAEQVIAQLEATLLEPERRAVAARLTDNMEAHQAYLLGNQYLLSGEEERYLRLAVEMLERAVELDTGFALAHAALCVAHSTLYHFRFDFTLERLEMARAAAERALQLQPGLPEGHRALGWYYYCGSRDYDRALQEFAIAAKELPNDDNIQLGVFAICRRQGRWDGALKALERWLRMDPQGYQQAIEYSDTFRFLRNYSKAEEEMRRAIAIAPDLPDAYYLGVLNYVLWDGVTDRARRLLESAPSLDSPAIEYQSLLVDLYDRMPESVLARLKDTSTKAFSHQHWHVPKELLECICLSEMGEEQRAEAPCTSAVGLLQREIEERPHDHRLYAALGRALALLGRKEEAVRAGENAVELMPISKDAHDGPAQVIELAKIYARVGKTDKAMDLIEELLSIPCDLSVGLLRLDPVWDPLRDHPRFQALLEKYEVE